MSFDSISPKTEDKPKGRSRMMRDKHKIRFYCEDAFGIVSNNRTLLTYV